MEANALFLNPQINDHLKFKALDKPKENAETGQPKVDQPALDEVAKEDSLPTLKSNILKKDTDEIDQEVVKRFDLSRLTDGLRNLFRQPKEKSPLQDFIQGLMKAAQAPQPANILESKVSANASVSQSLSVNLTTQEGDLVTLDFSALEAASYHAARTQSGFAHIQTQSYSEQYGIAVIGDLSEEEFLEIDRFVGSLVTSAEAFFDLGIDEALMSLSDLSYDPSIISAYRFDLRMQAVMSYEQVQTYQVQPRPTPVEPVQAFSATESYFKTVMEQAQSLPERFYEDFIEALFPVIEYLYDRDDEETPTVENL